MKAVTLGLRYGTNAIGNIIDIVVMKAFEGVLPKQVRTSQSLFSVDHHYLFLGI